VVFVARSARRFFALLALLVRVEAGLLKLVIGDGRVHAVNDELDPLLNLGDLFRKRRLAQLDPRACLVDQIDGLVREKRSGM